MGGYSGNNFKFSFWLHFPYFCSIFNFLSEIFDFKNFYCAHILDADCFKIKQKKTTIHWLLFLILNYLFGNTLFQSIELFCSFRTLFVSLKLRENSSLEQKMDKEQCAEDEITEAFHQVSKFLFFRNRGNELCKKSSSRWQ